MRKDKSPFTYQGVVYSTDTGRRCPSCGKAIAACLCKQAAKIVQSDGIVRVARETKGRGGKCVNVISGLALAPAELETLCTHLKKRCGTGGTVKDGAIEVQGEHVDKVMALLEQRGFRVKRAGG